MAKWIERQTCNPRLWVRISAQAGIVHDWGETLEQGTEPTTAPWALQCRLPTTPGVCALGWVKLCMWQKTQKKNLLRLRINWIDFLVEGEPWEGEPWEETVLVMTNATQTQVYNVSVCLHFSSRDHFSVLYDGWNWNICGMIMLS